MATLIAYFGGSFDPVHQGHLATAATTAPLALTLPGEHDQLADGDLGGVALGAVLVVPGAVVDLALDVELVALLAIALADVGELLAVLVVPGDQPVPGGLLLLLAAGILPLPARGEGEGRDATTTRRGSELGLSAEIADQDHLVETLAHASLQRRTERIALR